MAREIYRNSLAAPEAGQAANFVLWFPEPLPADFVLHWSFWPIREPGLAMVFFAARSTRRVAVRPQPGFHLVAQGADPIPPVAAATPPYRLRPSCIDGEVTFSVNSLQVLSWEDDGVRWGSRLGDSWLGLRQMAPLIAEYADLEVTTP